MQTIPYKLRRIITKQRYNILLRMGSSQVNSPPITPTMQGYQIYYPPAKELKIEYQAECSTILYCNQTDRSTPVRASKIFEHSDKLFQNLQARIKTPNQYLLTVYHVEKIIERNCCNSDRQIMKVIYEHMPHSLASILKEHATKRYFFTEGDMIKILTCLLTVLKEMHANNQPHGEIILENVKVQMKSDDKPGTFKLVERIFLNQSNWKVVEGDNRLQLIVNKGVLFSPSVLQCMKTNYKDYDEYNEKYNDIFAIGIIALLCMSFKKVTDFYNYLDYQIHWNVIENTIQEMKKNYPKASKIVNQMLSHVPNDKTAEEFLIKLQKVDKRSYDNANDISCLGNLNQSNVRSISQTVCMEQIQNSKNHFLYKSQQLCTQQKLLKNTQIYPTSKNIQKSYVKIDNQHSTKISFNKNSNQIQKLKPITHLIQSNVNIKLSQLNPQI